MKSENFLRNSANRFTFASSSAASISSSTQKGIGLRRSIANNIAIAVSARSPPLRSPIFCNFFPGGCANISIPASRTSSVSLVSKRSSPLPPPNSCENTPLKFSLILSNASINWSRIRSVSEAIIVLTSSQAFWISSRCLICSLNLPSVSSSVFSAAKFISPSLCIERFKSDITVSAP